MLNQAHPNTDNYQSYLDTGNRLPRRRLTLKNTIVIGGLAAIAVVAGPKVYDFMRSDKAKNIEAAEESGVNKMIEEGGKFYMGKLDVKPDGILRDQPAVMNFEESDIAYNNEVSRPENLTLIDAIVVTNEDGTWYGVPRESDREAGLSTAYIWVNSDDIESEVDPNLVASFKAGEDPESEAREEIAW